MPPIITEEMPSTEKRVSRIEGERRRLAAKADVAELRGELRAEIAKSEARTSERIAASEARNIRWMIALITLAVAAITLLDKLLG